MSLDSLVRGLDGGAAALSAQVEVPRCVVLSFCPHQHSPWDLPKPTKGAPLVSNQRPLSP